MKITKGVVDLVFKELDIRLLKEIKCLNTGLKVVYTSWDLPDNVECMDLIAYKEIQKIINEGNVGLICIIL